MSTINSISSNSKDYTFMLKGNLSIKLPADDKEGVVGQQASANNKVGSLYNSDRAEFSKLNLYSQFSSNNGNMNKMFDQWRAQRTEQPSIEDDHIVDNSDYVVSYKNDGVIKHPSGLTIIKNPQDRPVADMSFFLEAAEKYSKIRGDQDFSVRPTDDSSFLNGIMQAIYGDGERSTSVTEVMSQVDKIVRELGEQIKETGKADFAKLESEFEIDGEKIKATDLMKMVSAYDSLTDKIMEEPHFMDPYSTSSRFFAEQGMVKSFATAFYGDFSSKVADRIGQNISNKIEGVMSESQKMTEDFIKNLTPSDGRDYITYNGTYDTIKETYERFANLDTSSKTAFQNSFKETNEWFKKSDDALFWTGETSGKYISDSFDKLMNSSWDFKS